MIIYLFPFHITSLDVTQHQVTNHCQKFHSDASDQEMVTALNQDHKSGICTQGL